MKKLKPIFILLFLLATITTEAQITIYKSYKNYESKTGVEYDKYLSWLRAGASVRLKLKKNGKKYKIHCKDIWGFMYKGALFRVDRKYNQPARLVSSEKIFYFENGVVHLNMLKNNMENAIYSFGYSSYVSKSLNSELVPLSSSFSGISFKKKERFSKANPEYKVLFDCIDYHSTLEIVRSCIDSFLESE